MSTPPPPKFKNSKAGGKTGVNTPYTTHPATIEQFFFYACQESTCIDGRGEGG